MRPSRDRQTAFARGLLSVGMLIATAALPGFASDRDGYLKQSLDDGAYLVTAPLRLQRQDLPYIAAGGSLLIGTMMLDRTVQGHLFPWSSRDPATDLRDFGNYAQLSGPPSAPCWRFMPV